MLHLVILIRFPKPHSGAMFAMNYSGHIFWHIVTTYRVFVNMALHVWHIYFISANGMKVTFYFPVQNKSGNMNLQTSIFLLLLFPNFVYTSGYFPERHPKQSSVKGPPPFLPFNAKSQGKIYLIPFGSITFSGLDHNNKYAFL